jgi:hypothetical protein
MENFAQEVRSQTHNVKTTKHPLLKDNMLNDILQYQFDLQDSEDFQYSVA